MQTLAQYILNLSLAIALNFILLQPLAAEEEKGFLSEFENLSDIQEWKQHSPEGFAPKWEDPEVDDGMLVLKPYASTWYNDYQGGHLYKEVTGDFELTTRLRVTGLEGGVPSKSFSLAGIMARAPRDFTAETFTYAKENWVFITTGSAQPVGTQQYETKATKNSLSALELHDAPIGWVDLRMLRVGHTFTLSAKPADTDDWEQHRVVELEDMPTMLNVGLIAYSNWNAVAATTLDYNELGAPSWSPDLIAHVDWVRLRRLPPS